MTTKAEIATTKWLVYQCENDQCEAFQGHWVKRESEDNIECLCPSCGEAGMETSA